MSQDAIHTGRPEVELDVDLDEDLFDFAGAVHDAEASEPEDLEEIFASFRDGPPAEMLLDFPAASAAAPVSAPDAAAHRAPPLPEALTPEPKNAPRPAALPKAHAVTRASEPQRELTPPPRQTRLSRSVVAIALSVTVLNSALALVAVRGRASGTDQPAPLGRASSEHEEGRALAASPHEQPASLPDPEAVDPVHAHPALDEARAQISRGEYSAARQRTYGLLAIIDRLEDPRRSALEADCQFLIAQSLHLEALARMGGTE